MSLSHVCDFDYDFMVFQDGTISSTQFAPQNNVYKRKSIYKHYIYLLALSPILRVPTLKCTDTADRVFVLVRKSDSPNIARKSLYFANLMMMTSEDFERSSAKKRGNTAFRINVNK